MIHLNENSAIPQYFYVTPFEARKDFVKFTNYLVSFTSRSTKTPQYFIANVILDNERYTKVQIITNTDIPTNGNIKIEGSGQYDFVIWPKQHHKFIPEIPNYRRDFREWSSYSNRTTHRHDTQYNHTR